ncbi:MAG: aminopeptidase [Actinomycetota bacterium]|nr:aminopeptidase [Actinomycetota bacterium]
MSPDEMIARGLNKSDVHTDFMVGGREVDVDGLTKDDARVPLLRDEVWQL